MSDSGRGGLHEENVKRMGEDPEQPSILRAFSSNENKGIVAGGAGMFGDAMRMMGGGQDEAAGGLEATYFCSVCLSNKRQSQGYKLASCGHYFCKPCISAYLTSQFQSRQVHPRCFHIPSDSKGACNREIDEKDIKVLATPEAWEKYTYFMNKETNDNFIDCPKCKKQQLGDPRKPWMTCQSDTCDAEFCFIHQNQHTKDESCGDYEARVRMEEKKNQAWRATNTKKCPKCGVDTEKNHGCNHMTCYICKTGWCWLCGEIIGNKVLPDHYKEGKCKGKQFTGEESVAYMAQWEATICIMLPALFLLLFSPLAFVMAIVVCIISPCFYIFLCCFDEENDRDVHICIGNCMNVLIFAPILLVTLPFWLPCFIYYTCVIAPRRVRLQAELQDANAVNQALADLEQGQQQPPPLDQGQGEGEAVERESVAPMIPGDAAAAGGAGPEGDAAPAAGDSAAPPLNVFPAVRQPPVQAQS